MIKIWTKSGFLNKNEYLYIAVSRVNTWISKTYKQRDYSWRYHIIAQEIVAKVLENFDPTIEKPKEIVVEKWRHRCGAEPRWFDFYIVIDDGLIHTIYIGGGNKWRALWYRLGPKFYTDGCLDFDYFVEIIDAIKNKRFVVVD